MQKIDTYDCFMTYDIFQLTTDSECIKDTFYGTFWTFISLFPIMKGANYEGELSLKDQTFYIL